MQYGGGAPMCAVCCEILLGFVVASPILERSSVVLLPLLCFPKVTVYYIYGWRLNSKLC